MASKGHVPPPFISRPPLGPGMMHPDLFGPSIRPPPGAYPPFDMLPPPEVLEQKLALQHGEIQRLATENERLAASHVALRQELGAAQQELQRLQAHIGAMKHEKEQQMRGMMDKIAKMENDLKAADSIKVDLEKARSEAQNLVAARQELIAKVEHLTQDFHRTYSEVQQIPILISELESLRQDYHHCKATCDYEKKLYSEHYESLQEMEKNYLSMSREVEKLRAELANAVNVERTAGVAYGDQNAVAPYGAAIGYKVQEPIGHSYEDGYNVSQGHGPLPTSGSPYGRGLTGYANAPIGSGYDAPIGSAYGTVPRTSGGGPGYERPSAYETSRVRGYDAPPMTSGGGQGQAIAPGSSRPYGSTTQSNLAVSGYAQLQGENHATPPTAAGAGYESHLRGVNIGEPSNYAGAGYEALHRGGNSVWR